jgi:hypothetical protein
MRWRNYRNGLSTIGAETNQALLIRVKNAAELARSQGAVASFAQALAPATIEARVYSEMAKKIGASLRDQHVDAEIEIVEPSKFRGAGNGHIGRDLGLVLGGGGLLAIGGWLAAKWWKRKK